MICKTAPSLIVKRSIFINHRKTSVCLEDAFWSALRTIAITQDITVPKLVALINKDRQSENLSSEIRLFVLAHYRKAASGREKMSGATQAPHPADSPAGFSPQRWFQAG
jgi:predicted DNA-binding ribbon-helix-helix protein